MSLSRIALSSTRFASRVWPSRSARVCPHFAMKIGMLNPEWYEFQSGFWMRLNLRDLIQQTILLEGIWDPSLTGFNESTLKPGDVFVDVGAHVGYFTLLAARRVGAAGTVLSVEPNPVALQQLQRHADRSRLRKVLMAHTACADSHDVVRL
jgi:hypothetical protein